EYLKGLYAKADIIVGSKCDSRRVFDTEFIPDKVLSIKTNGPFGHSPILDNKQFRVVITPDLREHLKYSCGIGKMHPAPGLFRHRIRKASRIALMVMIAGSPKVSQIDGGSTSVENTYPA